MVIGRLTITSLNYTDGTHEELLALNCHEYDLMGEMEDTSRYGFTATYTGEMSDLWAMYRDCFAGERDEFDSVVVVLSAA